MSGNKISSGASRPRKSINGFPGPAMSAGQRESGSSRSLSLHRNSASEKLSQSGLTCEKALAGPIVEGNSHKLIVKIPNQARCPAQSASGGSFEDPSIMNSRASSPVLAEKHDQFDSNLKEKSDAYQADVMTDVNTESWQSNDFKDVLTGSDEGDASPAAIPEQEHSRIVEDIRKAASSSYGSAPKPGKLDDASFNSINALIDSCVKYSEAAKSMSLGDDVGMNLLASVAAGEMSKSDLVSPTDSPQRNTLIVEDTCTGDDVKSKLSPQDNFTQDVSQLSDNGDGDVDKQGALWSEDCPPLSKQASINFSGDGKPICSSSEGMPAGERNEHFHTASCDLQRTADACLEASEILSERNGAASVSVPPGSNSENVINGEISKQLHGEKAVVISTTTDGTPDTNPRGSSSLLTEDKVSDVLSTIEDDKLAVEVGKNTHDSNEGLNDSFHMEKKPAAVMMNSECMARTDEEVMYPHSGKDLTSEDVYQVKVEKADEMDNSTAVNLSGRQGIGQENNNPPTIENQADLKSNCMETNVESKEVHGHHCSAAVPSKKSPESHVQETKQHVGWRGSKLAVIEADETEECVSTTGGASSSAAWVPEMDSKLKFDLNEGLVVDDGKYGDPINLTVHGCSSALHVINPLPFPVSSVSSGLPASITVAAAAKRPFVPPEDLLRSKGELGWKGSAATSAFRPAEPRKVLEMPLGTANSPLTDATASKHGRPLLDIDLNVPDERVHEDMASGEPASGTGSMSNLIDSHNLAQNGMMDSVSIRSSGGFGLDLNQVDEVNDVGQYPKSSIHRVETLLPPVKSSSAYGISSVELRRDFDLNNGPVLDDVSWEPSSFNPHGRGGMQSQAHVTGLRMNNPNVGNFSPWFPPGNYPGVTIPSVLPDRGEHLFPVVAPGAPQRLLGPTGSTPFTPDVYRGSLLSSSPALPFPSMPFQYPVFPFGTSFPLSSGTFSGGSTTNMDSSSGGRPGFPAVHSQLLGATGAVSTNCQRPYVVSLLDGGDNDVLVNNRKWVRQGLDLNAGPGPGGLDIERRDETLPLVSRQLSVASSQALVEEQARMYQVAGGVLKRKEPVGGWDTESFRYRHPHSSRDL
ncbi:unnamed protein product [Ilex paraguariensis]|uniref:Uncharacterized protein n=1 Tax=Ilex paraguariensis TaxID=185542 RepID=A0ABC8R9B0_9AQUA